MENASAHTFTGEYVTYWKHFVGRNASVDGTKLIDLEALNSYLCLLNLAAGDRVLDIGCGTGRLFPLLRRYTPEVVGIDPSPGMLAEASRYPYVALSEGRMEATRFENEQFDAAVTWYTFDVVQQELGLREVNRILKPGGVFLVTGKNLWYRPDDGLAFIAERNARLKNFPNHFTDLRRLVPRLGEFGFEPVHAFGFERRGDLGKNTPMCSRDWMEHRFYEYVLIGRKVQTCLNPAPVPFAHEFSSTAAEIACGLNYRGGLQDFFEWHKARFGG